MQLLGLQDKVGEASEDEIKIAFRKVAMTLHPDVQQHKNQKERELIHARFVQLKDAYEVRTISDRAFFFPYQHLSRKTVLWK